MGNVTTAVVKNLNYHWFNKTEINFSHCLMSHIDWCQVVWQGWEEKHVLCVCYSGTQIEDTLLPLPSSTSFPSCPHHWCVGGRWEVRVAKAHSFLNHFGQIITKNVSAPLVSTVFWCQPYFWAVIDADMYIWGLVFSELGWMRPPKQNECEARST